MAGQDPFLSVVIATRNRATLLRDCIQSLVEQDFPVDQYEIIVVDDGSTTETSVGASEIQARINRPTLRDLRPQGRGLTAARNAGLREALGDPIVFVDDDVVTPNLWLRSIADGTIRHPEAGCLGGPVRLRLEARPPRFCKRDPLGDSQLDLGDS